MKRSRPKHVEHISSDTRNGKQLPARFLFIVNDLNLDGEYPPEADRWGNIVPPETPLGYTQETPGKVFGYHDGIVTHEEIYTWYRPGVGGTGNIGFWTQETDEAGNALPMFNTLKEYSTFSVFNCGPFLPCVYGAGDVSDERGDFDGFRALHFSHRGGISQASPNGGFKYTAGRNAGFIGKLLSPLYSTAESRAPKSTGLAGELGLVIALMALSQSPGKSSAAFHNGAWRDNKWLGHRTDSAWPSLSQEPRGVMVHIVLDPAGGLGASAEEINHFEWYGVAVAG